MKVVAVMWTPQVNWLTIECGCGIWWKHPTHYTVAVCPRCHRVELWHGIEPRADEGIWSLPSMTIELLEK